MASNSEVETSSEETTLPTTVPADEEREKEREKETGEQESVLAAGLLSVLSPAVQQIDDRVEQVRSSQNELREQIDKLAQELRQLSDKQRVPIDLDTYIKKLAISKRRILLVNDILQNVHERMDKLQKNITKETVRQRSAIEAQ